MCAQTTSDMFFEAAEMPLLVTNSLFATMKPRCHHCLGFSSDSGLMFGRLGM
jgi:hypothetical protein